MGSYSAGKNDKATSLSLGTGNWVLATERSYPNISFTLPSSDRISG